MDKKIGTKVDTDGIPKDENLEEIEIYANYYEIEQLNLKDEKDKKKSDVIVFLKEISRIFII